MKGGLNQTLVINSGETKEQLHKQAIQTHNCQGSCEAMDTVIWVLHVEQDAADVDKI